MVRIERIENSFMKSYLDNIRKFLWLARNDIFKLTDSDIQNIGWRNFSPMVIFLHKNSNERVEKILFQ